MIERIRNTKSVIALTTAISLGTVGCGGHSSLSISGAEQIAHSAGFLNVTPRNDGKDHDLWVQFGACLLPVVATKDYIELDADVNNMGSITLGDNEVLNGMSLNLGAHESGDDVRLRDALNDLTQTRLEALTRKGLTGLEVCLLTDDQIKHELNQNG